MPGTDIRCRRTRRRRPVPGLVRAGDAARFLAGQYLAGLLEGLRDVDQRDAVLARPQGRRHPFADRAGAAIGDHLGRRDIRTARIDRHLKTDIAIEALVLGNELSGELGLRDLFARQCDLVLRRGRAGRHSQWRRCAEQGASLRCHSQLCFLLLEWAGGPTAAVIAHGDTKHARTECCVRTAPVVRADAAVEHRRRDVRFSAPTPALLPARLVAGVPPSNDAC